MKMKFLFFFVSGHLCFIVANAQAIDYNTIILPTSANNVGIEEKLVQLAWNNNPFTKIEYNNLSIAEKSVTLNYAAWLNIFTFRSNINEYTINPGRLPEGRNYYYPRYNFSASFGFGLFLEVPTKTKISKLMVINQEELINAKKLQTRANVLKKYQNYKLNKEILKTQTSFTDNAYSNFLIAEQQFKNGNISIEEFNQNLKMYQDQLILKLQKQTNFEIIIIELEEMIGVRIRDILSNYN